MCTEGRGPSTCRPTRGRAGLRQGTVTAAGARQRAAKRDGAAHVIPRASGPTSPARRVDAESARTGRCAGLYLRVAAARSREDVERADLAGTAAPGRCLTRPNPASRPVMVVRGSRWRRGPKLRIFIPGALEQIEAYLSAPGSRGDGWSRPVQGVKVVAWCGPTPARRRRTRGAELALSKYQTWSRAGGRAGRSAVTRPVTVQVPARRRAGVEAATSFGRPAPPVTLEQTTSGAAASEAWFMSFRRVVVSSEVNGEGGGRAAASGDAETRFAGFVTALEEVRHGRDGSTRSSTTRHRSGPPEMLQSGRRLGSSSSPPTRPDTRLSLAREVAAARAGAAPDTASRLPKRRRCAGHGARRRASRRATTRSRQDDKVVGQLDQTATSASEVHGSSRLTDIGAW